MSKFVLSLKKCHFTDKGKITAKVYVALGNNKVDQRLNRLLSHHDDGWSFTEASEELLLQLFELGHIKDATMLRMIFYHFIKDSSVLQLFLEGKISAEFVEEMLCKDYDYMVSRECEALIARAAFAGKLKPDTIHRHLVANGYFLALGGQY